MKIKGTLYIVFSVLLCQCGFAATIYVGADGKFYDSVAGGNEVSYATGDSINFQTGVSSWNITQNISGGGGIYINAKTVTIDGAYSAALGGLTSGGTFATGPSISLLNGASMTLSYVDSTSRAFNSIIMQGTSSAQTTLTLSGYSGQYPSFNSVSIGEYSTLNASGAFIVPTGTMTVSAHAAVNIGCLQIQGGTFISNADEGSITTTNSSINMMAASTLVLNTSNAIKLYNGAQSDLTISVARNTASLVLGADQVFKKLNFSFGGGATSVLMTIDSNGYGLDFSNTDSSFATLGTNLTVLIEDFTDGKIHFGTTLDVNEDGSIKYLYAVIDEAQTALYQRADGYLYLTVPEPAEWAALFGAFALGMAIWRRRRMK